MMIGIINQRHSTGRILLKEFLSFDSIVAATELVEDGFVG
jgi:hypothetical protein